MKNGVIPALPIFLSNCTFKKGDLVRKKGEKLPIFQVLDEMDGDFNHLVLNTETGATSLHWWRELERLSPLEALGSQI